MFNTVGWFSMSMLWSSIRGDNVPWDPDIRGAVTNGLLNTDFAVVNISIGVGVVSDLNLNLNKVTFQSILKYIAVGDFSCLGSYHYPGRWCGKQGKEKFRT